MPLRPTVLISALCLAALAQAPAHAQKMSSVYTDLQADKTCTVFAAAEEGDGDWANLVCDGWRGYPVFLQYSDARESLFYGYPPAGDMAPVWESFAGFNASGDTIEWRLEQRGENLIPVATIHRWFVSDPDGGDDIQVLVVEKVGQPYERDGCAMAYIVATGNENANEKARSYADKLIHGFVCGDQPAIDAGSVPVPEFTRFE
jgi:hypothetical protein